MTIITSAKAFWSKSRRTNAVFKASRPMVEPLEGRTLLSASVAAVSADLPHGATAHHIALHNAPHKPNAASKIYAHSNVEVYADSARAGASPAVVFNSTPTVSQLSPAQISQAYGYNFALPKGSAATGAGETIALIEGGNTPSMQSDLHVFDEQYFGGVDPSFTVVNLGSSAATPGDPVEADLDVEWAHAMAPQAKILLVEAKSMQLTDLLAAVDKAVALGANVVSMSWGSDDFSTETAYDRHFEVPNVTFVAGSGDRGSPELYPAASPYVLGVGGTSLALDVNNNVTGEVGWVGSGGGVSAYESRPAYQPTTYSNGATTGIALSNRGVPDVSYNADPATGVAVYDSYPGDGWIKVGGTSAGAPQWAAIIALADQVRAQSGQAALGTTAVLSALYANPAAFNDVVSGTSTGTPNYTAAAGYDLVTGLGSPRVSSVVSSLVAPISTAPAAPPGLWAIPADEQVNLNWNGSLGATSYNVYRSTDGTNYSLDATVSAVSFVDTGLTDGVSYSYQVTAVNAIGESPASVAISATPQVPPAAPTQLTATASSTTAAVTLQWTASPGVSTYVIKRATVSGGPWVIVYKNVSGTSFDDTDVPSGGATYYYVVAAVTSQGEQSANSNQASATIIPDPPQNLTATSGNTQIALAWSASNGATSYTILRSTKNGGGYSVIASGITTTSFTDSKVTVGTTYYYVVQAVDTGGPSANSNQASATAKRRN